MASDTGEMEDRAKKKNDAVKDSLALFGRNELEDTLPVFRWKELEEGVWGDKLQFLLTHFRLAGLNDSETRQTLLPAGKSLLSNSGNPEGADLQSGSFCLCHCPAGSGKQWGKECRKKKKVLQ